DDAFACLAPPPKKACEGDEGHLTPPGRRKATQFTPKPDAPARTIQCLAGASGFDRVPDVCYASNFSITLPSRKSWIGRPVAVVSSLCGSMPRQRNIVADTSSGVQGPSAGAMPLASVLPW